MAYGIEPWLTPAPTRVPTPGIFPGEGGPGRPPVYGIEPWNSPGRRPIYGSEPWNGGGRVGFEPWLGGGRGRMGIEPWLSGGGIRRKPWQPDLGFIGGHPGPQLSLGPRVQPGIIGGFPGPTSFVPRVAPSIIGGRPGPTPYEALLQLLG